MTLYNCSNCKGVHDSSDPGCPNNAIGCKITFGIGNMHPDLKALIEFKEATLAWLVNEDAMFLLLRQQPPFTDEQRAEFERLSSESFTLYDRMLTLARRWHPLPHTT